MAATEISGQVPLRSGELSRLVSLVGAAGTGARVAAELAGGPGAGKTRLLTELAREATGEGKCVLRGLGSEAFRHVPFHPFIAAFTNWRDSDSGTTVPGAAALIRTLTTGTASDSQIPDAVSLFTEFRKSLAECLPAASGGLLLLLDDFHWADPCSVELLDMLVGHPTGGRLSVVMAHRPRQSPVALRAAVQHGVESGTVRTVELGPLTLRQSAALLGRAPDSSGLARLHEQAEGNPLYLTALAEAGAKSPAELPETLARSGPGARLLAETTSLGERTRTILRAAAVLGNTFDVTAVAEVAETDHQETSRILDDLKRRDLIRTVPDGWRRLGFRHELLRHCVYGDTDASWQIGAHRRALAHLSSTGALPTELAPHIERSCAGIEPSDAAVLASAARTALHAGRPVDAARWLAYALRLQRAVGALDSLESVGPGLWRPVVQGLAAEGEVRCIQALGNEILAGPSGAGDGTRADTVAFLATVSASLGHGEEAQALLTAELPADHSRATSTRRLLQVQQQLTKVLAGAALARADIEMLVVDTGHSDPLTAAGALALRGLCAVMDTDVDIRLAEGVLDASAQALDGFTAGGAAAQHLPGHLLVLSWAEALIGRYGPARAHAERALATVRERGDAHLLPPLLNTLGYTHYQSGQMAEALTAVDEARTAAFALGRADHVGLAEAVSAAAWSQLGRSGEPPREQHSPRLPDEDRPPRTSLDALLYAEAALARGDAEAALALLLPEGDSAWRVSEPVAVLAARGYELLAAASADRGPDDARTEQWAERAVAAAAAGDLPEQRGHALLAHGHVLRCRQLIAEATRCYEEAEELLGGETPAGTRARELARAPEQPAGRGEEDALTELTQREREVAGLAGRGLKTKDIAQQLRVSPRTIDVHLSRIYGKLGVSSRSGLVRLMARSN
ncbi:AAA family ATPase [Streptomyces iconiensis]|uniref:LuxR C-terminal-related transcriptional regulator n=1 Tax=Streptomyces iconiensis TaxID=1384038 RepID=A0ABT7A806_9ACTN|nr:LuxR family transcriptional regulator [Streptomyces iconiensis]MDJ1137467.1 LuxR C-terminal-related transcriptional regulator [Streptomyces iconiensis]